MYSSDKNANIVISRPRHDFSIISEWFYEDFMVLNDDKGHFLSVGFHEPLPDFSFNGTQLKMLQRKRFLG